MEIIIIKIVKKRTICLRNEGSWPRRIGGRSRAEDQKRPSEEASQGPESGGDEAMDGREPAKMKQEEKKKKTKTTKKKKTKKVRTRMGDEEAMGPARLSHPLGEGLSLALHRSTEPVRLWRGLGGEQCFPSRGSSKRGSRRRRSASSGRARGAAAGSLPRGQSWEFHSFLLIQREISD